MRNYRKLILVRKLVFLLFGEVSNSLYYYGALCLEKKNRELRSFSSSSSFVVVLWPVAALGKAKGTTRLFLLLISAAVFNAITHVSSLQILYMLDPKCLQQSGPSALYICYDTSRWFLMCRKKLFSFYFFEVTLAETKRPCHLAADFVFAFKMNNN